MLQNSWSNKLTQEPRIATILNVPAPTILYQTGANQLIAHSQAESTPLPIRKDILAMCSLNKAQVLLLTRYQLSCFDLINNNELFSLQFENAQNLFAQEGFIYVICGCDLFCYDERGEEQYVNHSPSLIEAVTTVNFKGNREVVVGLNDLGMIRYRGVNITLDYGKVVGIPASICWISEGVLVGTQEGTVAYYESKKSKWKAKSHHPVFKVMAYRTETTYLAIIGRKNGTVELKDWKGKGETIFKVKLQQELVGLTIYDFREEDNQQLICIMKSGKVTGLNMLEQAKATNQNQLAPQIDLGMKNLEALQNEKLSLEFEINQLKETIAASEETNQSPDNENILAADFNFQTYLLHEEQGLGLTIQCFNGYISGLIFEEPIMPISLDRAESIKYFFDAKNMVFGEINCYALVHSSYTSKTYEARGFKITLPRFWKFGFIEKDFKEKVEGGIRFKCVERNARYIKWVSQCFFMKWKEEEKNKAENSQNLRLKFYNKYDNVALELSFTPKESKVEIFSDCLKTLGEVFQDLIEYIGVSELDSELSFPKEKPKLMATLQVIERLSQAKVSISSEMAEAIENIKFMLVKGESARCVGSMRELRRTYTDIMGFNRNLMTEIEKKNQNTKQLSEALKTLGQVINQTANVRYGKAKEKMIAGCREAIKRKEFPKIVAIMERGASAV